MKNIEVKVNVTKRQYLKFMFGRAYRRFAFIFITLAGLAMLVMTALYYKGDVESVAPPYFQLGFGLFSVVGIPLLMYYQALKNYKTNMLLKEKSIYLFDSKSVKITGDNFNSDLPWKAMYRVKESSNWILLYQNRQVANLLPKCCFSKQQLSDFRNLVSSVDGLKIRLKR